MCRPIWNFVNFVIRPLSQLSRRHMPYAPKRRESINLYGSSTQLCMHKKYISDHHHTTTQSCHHHYDTSTSTYESHLDADADVLAHQSLNSTSHPPSAASSTVPSPHACRSVPFSLDIRVNDDAVRCTHTHSGILSGNFRKCFARVYFALGVRAGAFAHCSARPKTHGGRHYHAVPVP